MSLLAENSPEHVAARRILLDALEALEPHKGAVVVAGAQAVYLRTGPNSLPVADLTTDGDLAIDPSLLPETPRLGELMEAAGFKLAEPDGSPEPGIWAKRVEIDAAPADVPVDLIVPAEVAPPGGRRGARLPGHGKLATRKIPGLEAALVNNDVLEVSALDPDDRRTARPRVAGVAALLVAKTHKIDDRIEGERRDRLDDKDAADLVRLMQATPPAAVAATLGQLLENPIAGPSTRFAIRRFRELFGSRAGLGIEMAARSLRVAMPEERVRAICLAYTESLCDDLP